MRPRQFWGTSGHYNWPPSLGLWLGHVRSLLVVQLVSFWHISEASETFYRRHQTQFNLNGEIQMAKLVHFTTPNCQSAEPGKCFSKLSCFNQPMLPFHDKWQAQCTSLRELVNGTFKHKLQLQLQYTIVTLAIGDYLHGMEGCNFLFYPYSLFLVSIWVCSFLA